jgi:hypothetical protein
MASSDTLLAQPDVFSHYVHQPEGSYGDAFSGPRKVPLELCEDKDAFSGGKSVSTRHRGRQFAMGTPHHKPNKVLTPRRKIRPIDAEVHVEPFRDQWKLHREHLARPESIARRGKPFVAVEAPKPLPWKGSESAYQDHAGELVTIPTRNPEVIAGGTIGPMVRRPPGGSPRQMGDVCGPPKKGKAGGMGSIAATFPGGEIRAPPDDYRSQEQLRDQMVAGRNRPNGDGTRGQSIVPAKGSDHERQGPMLASTRHPYILDQDLLQEHGGVDGARQGVERVAEAEMATLQRRLSARKTALEKPFYNVDARGRPRAAVWKARTEAPTKPGIGAPVSVTGDPYIEPGNMWTLSPRVAPRVPGAEKLAQEIAAQGSGPFATQIGPSDKSGPTDKGTASPRQGGDARRAFGTFHPQRKVATGFFTNGDAARRSKPRGRQDWSPFNYLNR